MITWNEESIIGAAINSTVGLADEIIVVDTGSEDNTVEIATKLGCLVSTGADRYHKAQSRNRAISEASGDWIIILDCDEQIADPEGLREFLSKTDKDGFTIRLQYKDKANKTTLEFPQMRVWKKGAWLYKYRAHELPIKQDPKYKQGATDFVWEHRSIPARNSWKLQYTLDRLLMDLKEWPKSSRTLYYLGRQYCYLKKWKEALKIFDRYMKIPDHDECNALYRIAQCHKELKNPNKQIDALYRACALSPLRREWWGEIAELYYARGHFDLACGILACMLKLPKPKNDYVDDYWHGHYIHDLYARSLYKTEHFAEGRKHARIALKMRPGDLRLKSNLSWFSSHLDEVPDRHLKVLFLTNHDWAGAGYRLAKAINDYTVHEAKLVCINDHEFGYGYDVLSPSPEKLKALIEWADIVNAYDDFPLPKGKPGVKTYLGSYYRMMWPMENAHTVGIQRFCTTIDLSEYGAKWIGLPIENISRVEPTGILKVVHAPTGRNKKGTNIVLQAFENINNVELDIIEGIDWDKCIDRKSKASILIDQVGKEAIGYGCNSLEAWALGMTVISDASDDRCQMIIEEVGYLPFYRVRNADELEKAIEFFKDENNRNEWAATGKKYIEEWHDPQTVTDNFISLCYGAQE